MRTLRSIDKLIEEQVKRWESSRRQGAAERRHEPVICISRLPGCDGRGIGEELARRLKFDFFDREVLRQVSESSHLSEAILNTVDERTISAVEEWVESLFMERYLCGEYLCHLSKVLMTIAAHGRAVVLGHGAGFILKPELCLRVLLVAPLEDRVAAMAKKLGVKREAARGRVIQAESERRGFVRNHFHADMLDPVRCDLALNTAALGREATLSAIQAAWESKRG